MDNGYWKCGLPRIDMYMKEGRREIVIRQLEMQGNLFGALALSSYSHNAQYVYWKLYIIVTFLF